MMNLNDGKLKLGLAGLYFPVMGAGEYGIYDSAMELVGGIARRLSCELVVWPRMISGADDAAAASRFFEERGVDFLLVQASSLAMGDAALPLVDRAARIGVWVVDEPTYSGELPLNSLTGYNLCVSLIRGRWGDEKKLRWFWGSGGDFEARLASTIVSLSALKRLKGCRIASIGGIVPGFDNLEYREDSFEKSLGVEMLRISLDELFHAAESATREEVDAVKKILTGQARCVRVPDSLMDDTARICRALDVIREREDLDACALRCWPEFQTWKNIAPCAAIAWANDHCMPTSCEGDAPGAVAMLLGSILSGSATTMNDPVALDRETGCVQMWHCGPGPASWADGAGQCLEYHHTLNRRLEPDASPAGVSSDISFAQGPVTMLRIRGDGLSLFVLEAEVVHGPASPYPGSGGWMGKLRMDGKTVAPEDLLHMMAAYGLEHHYPVMKGHHYSSLREIAAWAGWKILPRIDAREFPVI